VYINFVKLLQKYGLTPYEVSKATGIGQSTFSDWKSGKSKPKNDKLQKIANFLKVDVKEITGEPAPYCLSCGFQYEDSEIDEHKKIHSRWESAVKRYGFCWPYTVRENIKSNAYQIINNEDEEIEKCKDACTELFKAYFSRSLYDYYVNNGELEHPKFEQYAAMLLNQQHWKNKLSEHLYALMIDEFGNIDGIDDGNTYYKTKIDANVNIDIDSIQPTSMLPIYNCIAAGIPIFVDSNTEGYYPALVKNPKEYYYLRVKGESMIGAGIKNNSLVLVHKQNTASENQIVACRINGDEYTLKRFSETNNTVILLSENPDIGPILVPKQQFNIGNAEIIGVVKQILIDL